MKKLFLIGALAVAAPANAAVTINFVQGGSAVAPGHVVYEDFEDELGGAPGQSIGTNAFVFNSSPSGVAARPAFAPAAGNYAAVLGVPTFGLYTTAFAPSTAFSFDLGSLDTYNSLELLFASGPSLVLSGLGITNGPLANGDQVLGATNGRVSYTIGAGDPLLVGARFRSTQNSFEFDRLAIQAVPEPATWMMMILGFGAIGFGMRRRRSTGKLALA